MKVLLPVYRELHDNVIVTLSSDISMRCGEDDDSRYRPAFYSDCRSQPARLTVTDIRAHHAAHAWSYKTSAPYVRWARGWLGLCPSQTFLQ